MKRALVIALIALAAGAPLFAQEEHCTPFDTPKECWQRFVPPEPKGSPEQSASDAQKLVSAANTGLSSLVSPSESALKDFLTLLSASFESSSLTESGPAMTFDWNPRFGTDQAIKFEAVFAKPGLSALTTTKLATNAAGLATLKDSLTNTDDVTGSLTYSPVSESFGRSIVPHRAYFQSLVKTVFTSEAAKANDAMQRLLEDLKVNPSSFGTKAISAITADVDKQKELIARIEAAGTAAKKTFATADSLTNAFAKLLNNQPQPFASVLYHERKDIVGPEELIVKATYEYGFRNLNAFKRRYGIKCDPLILATADNDAKLSCIALLQEYAGGKTPDAGTDGGRVAFSAEYRGARPIHVNVPLYSLQYDVAAGHTFNYSVTGGWVIAPRPDRRSGRIDLAINYEDIRNAAAVPTITNPSGDVKDRFFASITYTQKISDTMSFPISLIYANHASSLSTVDRKLNAHFGLHYKLPTAQP